LKVTSTDKAEIGFERNVCFSGSRSIAEQTKEEPPWREYLFEMNRCSEAELRGWGDGDSWEVKAEDSRAESSAWAEAHVLLHQGSAAATCIAPSGVATFFVAVEVYIILHTTYLLKFDTDKVCIRKAHSATRTLEL
jgi:hypothetical protein